MQTMEPERRGVMPIQFLEHLRIMPPVAHPVRMEFRNAAAVRLLERVQRAARLNPQLPVELQEVGVTVHAGHRALPL